MIDWTDHLADLNAAVTDPAAFGEPVIRPDTTEVSGIFDPRGDLPGAAWPEIGAALRLSQQGNPVVYLAEAAAAGLAENDRLTIRGADYVITRLDPDGSGLVRLELMPAERSGALPTDRWQ